MKNDAVGNENRGKEKTEMEIRVELSAFSEDWDEGNEKERAAAILSAAAEDFFSQAEEKIPYCADLVGDLRYLLSDYLDCLSGKTENDSLIDDELLRFADWRCDREIDDEDYFYADEIF